jgi:hypothetical protein
LLDDVSLFESHNLTRVVVEFDAVPSTAEVSREPNDTISVTWRLSPQEALDVADALDVLAFSEHPAHQYLETAGSVQIIVSVDEYDPSILDGN